MMPKIEYDNLYKFITSLGCIIMASAFIFPWIFTQSTTILLIENSKIEALPPISKGILNNRLDKISFIENFLPLISSILFAIGLFVFIYGALGWNERQSKMDQEADSNLSAALIKNQQIVHASQQEIEEKIRVETGENTNSQKNKSSREEQRIKSEQRRKKYIDLENKFFSLLKENFTQSEILSNQKIQGNNEVFDIIINNKNNRGQLAFDIKYSSVLSLTHLVYRFCINLAYATESLHIDQALLKNPRDSRDAKVAGILVFIYPNEANIAAPKQIEKINHVLKRKIGILVISEGSLNNPEVPDKIFELWAGESDIIFIDS